MQRDAIISRLKVNLQKAQQHMKNYADARSKPFQLAIGDMVLVKLQPYRQHSMSLRKKSETHTEVLWAISYD